jgi:hypothetical protein
LRGPAHGRLLSVQEDFMRRIAICLILLSACATARADDPAPMTWSSPIGDITCAEEDGSFGVFEYPLPFGDNIGLLYIDGLAGEFGGPGPLEGYWSEPDVSHDNDVDDGVRACPFAIIDGRGRTTHNWGRLKIAFAQDDFPGDWIMLRGRSLAEPADVLAGKLKAAAPVSH